MSIGAAAPRTRGAAFRSGTAKGWAFNLPYVLGFLAVYVTPVGYAVWQSVHQQKRSPQENVDVYLNTDGDRILGLAVIASDPRSFTIVNIIGSIDVDKLAKLKGQFHIPNLSTHD